MGRPALTISSPVRSLQSRFARVAAGLASFSAVVVTIAAMSVLLLEARVSIDQSMEMKSILVRERLSTLGAAVDDLATLSRSSLVATALTDSGGRDAYLRPFLEERARGAEGDFVLFDYRGRMIFSTTQEPGRMRLADEVAAALTADGTAGARAARLIRTEAGATLVAGFPVQFAYSRDVIGVLVRVIPVAALFDRISEEIGDAVSLVVTSDGETVFSDADADGPRGRVYRLDVPAGGGVMKISYEIGFRTNPFIRQAITMGAAAFVATIGFMLLAVAVARRLARLLTFRLERLVEASTAFARGEVRPIERDGSADEIDILAGALEQAFEDRRAAESRLLFIARHDVLTGLANRAWFEDQVTAAVERSRRGEGRIAVLFIDLDRFKPINDHLGHGAGDEVLRHVAHRLSERLRRTDVVSRRGGDEFTVLLDPVRTTQEALAVADSLVERVREPIVLSNGETVHTGATIGVSLYPDDAGGVGDLMKNADAALYAGKADGRGRAVLFSGAAGGGTTSRYRIEARLREALREGGLSLVYQPQIRLSDDAVVGWEALLRWNDPELGIVPPSDIISVAEETGLIDTLGDWIARRAFLQNKELMELTAAAGSRLAVNVSPRQFRQSGLYERLIRLAKESGFALDRLEIEITETALFNAPAEADLTLRALRAAGVKVAIDDFGVGYSSLGRLNRLKIDRLKIDAGFVHAMVADDESKEIVRAVITMGRAMGLEVLAEGVETEEQKRLLRELGCDAAQGHVLAEPMSPAELYRFVTTPPSKRSQPMLSA